MLLWILAWGNIGLNYLLSSGCERFWNGHITLETGAVPSIYMVPNMMFSQVHFLQMFHYAWNYKMLFQPKRSNASFAAGVMGVGVQTFTWEVKFWFTDFNLVFAKYKIEYVLQKRLNPKGIVRLCFGCFCSKQNVLQVQTYQEGVRTEPLLHL